MHLPVISRYARKNSKKLLTSRRSLGFRPRMELLEDRTLPTTYFFTNPAAILIPGAGTGPGPGAPYPSNIAVSNLPGTVTDVTTATVSNLSHTGLCDVDILLTAPNPAVNVQLMSFVGTGGVVNETYTFQDGAPFMPFIGDPGSGTFSPTQFIADPGYEAPAPAGPYGTTMSALNGTSPNGTWSLYVRDDFSSNSGTIAGGWSLAVTTTTGTVFVYNAATNPGVHDYTLRVSAGNFEIINTITGFVLASQSVASTTAIDINGLDGANDTFRVNYAGGLTIPAGGLDFDGGTQASFEGDVIVLDNGSPTTVTHNLATSSTGSVAITGQGLITYSGLEPIFDNLNPVNRVFNFSGAANTDVVLQDVGGFADGFNLISAFLSAESVQFFEPTTSLTVNLGGGDDIMEMLRLDSTWFAPTININGDSGQDEIRVAATPAAATTNINTNLGFPVDRTVLGAIGGGFDATNFAQFNTGISSLDFLLGPVVSVSDSGGVGQLYADDSGDATADAVTFSQTSITGAAPATINYDGFSLDVVQLALGTGSDAINVTGTGSYGSTTIFGNGGNDVFVIAGDMLTRNNVFNGGPGTDEFTLNIPAGTSIGTNSFSGFGISSVLINGDGPASDSANRDRVTVNDSSGLVRALNYNYGVGGGGAALAGGLNIEATFGGFGLFGPDDLPLQIRTTETVIFNDTTGAPDFMQVVGTSADDDITVAHLPTGAAPFVNSARSALVFLGGDPYVNSPPEDLTFLPPHDLPGLAGDNGAGGPDLLLNGIGDPFGLGGFLYINGNGASTARGDRAITYFASEVAITTGAGNDIFGFGAGVLIPAFGPGFYGSGFAYDTINVADQPNFFGNITLVSGSNNVFGPQVGVAAFTFSGFFTGANSQLTPNVVVNGGDEFFPGPGGIADDITATISAFYGIQINGNLPFNAFAPNGDRLTLAAAGPVNVFSDAACPPNVTITSGVTNPFGITFSSIERVNVSAAPNGIVNIIGDNNDNPPGNIQNDYFKIRGADVNGDGEGVNEFTLQIGGDWDPTTGAVCLSAPIFFDNVTRINVSGGSAIGFDANGNAIPETTNTGIDCLDITPYADNTPRGWGIETYYNEGDPDDDGGLGSPDLLIFNGVFGVSENIVIQPSAPMAGQVFDNNAATNTPIAVVNYVLNSNIIINGSSPAGTAGDTDNLFLRGTDPANPSTSGLDDFLADFTQTGGPGTEMVRVQDDVGAALLYNLQNFTNFNTINLQGLAGSDFFNIIGRNDGSLTINVDGEAPTGGGGVFDIDTLALPGVVNANDVFQVFAGATNDSGRATALRDGAGTRTIINFRGTETVNVSGGFGTGIDSLSVFGSDGANNWSVNPTTATSGSISVDSFTDIQYTGLGTGTGGMFSAVGLFADNPPFANLDSVLFTGTAGADTYTYTPTSATSGMLQLLVGGNTVNFNMLNFGTAKLDAIDGADTLNVTVTNAIIVPGATSDSGTVVPLDAAGHGLLPLSFLHVESANVTGGTVVVDGTADSDMIDVSAVAVVTVRNQGGVIINQFNLAGTNRLIANGLGGDDTFNIVSAAIFPGGILVIGGEPGAGSDILNLTGMAATAENVTIAPNAGIPTDQIITGLGFPMDVTGVEKIRYTGAGGNDTLIVSPGPGDNIVRVQGGTSAGSALVTSDSLPNIEFTALNTFVLNLLGGVDVATFATGNRTLPSAAAAFHVASGFGDTLVIEGQNGATAVANDNYTVTKPAVGSVAVTDNSSGVTVTETTGVLAGLQINTLGGDDLVTVDVGATDVIGVPIVFDGGTGFDRLVVSGTPATAVNAVTYTPTNVGAGRMLYTSAGGGTLMTIDFANLEPVVDLVPAATLIVNGTNSNNAINYTQGSVATRGLVSVDNFETIEFSNKVNLTINGLAGSDTININNSNTPTGLTGITVNAGDPTGSDTVIVNAQAGVFDPMVVEPTAQGAGTVTSFFGNLPDVTYTGTEHLKLVGQLADGDPFGVDGTIGDDQIEYFPGATPDVGTIRGTMDQNNATGNGPFTLGEISFTGMAQISVLVFNSFGQVGGTDSFVYNGTSVNDNVSVNAAGPNSVFIANTVNGLLFANLLVDNIASAVIQTHAGDDTVNVAGDIGIPLAVHGGDPSASDVVNFLGTGGDVVVDLAEPSVGETGFARVSLTGVEVLNTIALGGAILVNGTAGPDIIAVTPTGTDTTTITRATQNLTVNTNNTGTLTVDALGGNDTVAVLGSDAVDTVTVTYAATTTVTFNAFKTVSLPAANTEFLQLNTLGGVDAITLNNNATIVTDINAGGPTAADTITYNFTSGTPRVTQGDVSTSGLIDQAGLNVSFSDVQLLNVTTAAAASSLVIRATDDNDTIAVGLVGITAAWINDGTVIRYNSAGGTNFSTVTVQGRFGDDSFSITPHAGVALIIQGGDPTASDTVIVNGTTGADTVNISPTAADAATVQVNAFGLVTVQTVEHLTYSGLGGNDSLTVITPAGGQLIQLTPGSLAGEGSIAMRDFLPGGNPLLPMSFTGISANGALAFADAGGIRVDDLTVIGTAASNAFSVDAAGLITLDTITAGVNNRTLIPVSTPGVTSLEMVGLDGDDVFNVAGNHPFASGIFVDGGNPSASDALNFAGSGAVANLITADFGAHTVQEAGFGAVSFTGVETLNVDANAHSVTINATTGNDSLAVTPTGLNAATARLTSSAPDVGSTPVVNVSEIATLTVNMLAGSDNLRVVANENANTIGVTGTAVAITGLETVNYVGAENLQVFGLAGDDIFDVTPAASTTIFIDGGDPIGSTAGDLLIPHPAGAFQVEPGPENDEGGLVSVGAQRLSWDHIEALVIVGGVPGGPGVPGKILGTNGDDDITIIARDSSTHVFPGVDGVQDFTVSVNTGPAILFVNQAQLFVDALAGDDDIVLREPAPNGAVWDVDVFIAAGPPAAVTGDQGDVFELETPGTQAVIYSPTGLDTAIITDSTNSSVITLAPFLCPVNGLPSSPGGIEQVVYQGLGGGDTLTINGRPQDDTFIFNPNNGGSGSHSSNLAPAFSFTGATILTVNGSTGFDLVQLLGTAGNDVVTSTATVISMGGGTLTIGSGMEQLDVLTFGGNDNIDLDLNVAGLQKLVDAGTGNDIVNMLGTIDATIIGGLGDDALTGSPAADLIYGDDPNGSGGGNDTLVGAAGNDTIFGGAGNDRFGDPAVRDPAANDAGNDQFHGEAGSDEFFWDPGDGDDLIEGGGDSDQLFFFGNAGAEQFFLFADTVTPSRFHLFRVQAAIDIDAADLEEVNLNPLGGTDTVTVGRSDLGVLSDLSTTTVRVVDVSLGADAAADSVFFDGRPLDDNLLVSVSSGIVKVAGLSYDMRIDGSDPTLDRLTVRSNEGNDIVKAQPPVENTILITLDGGDGNDFLSADAIIIGGPGNDTLIGGPGNDSLFGNAGEDLFVGGTGDDTIDGGPDYDTILVEGTSGNDRIDVFQTSATQLQYEVGNAANGFDGVIGGAGTETDTLVTVAGVRTVERVRVEARDGDDIIRVQVADALGVDAFVNSLRMDVDGGADFTRDRLAVVDNGTGDLSLYRKGEDDSTGSISIGPGNAEPLEHVFQGVEFVNPVLGVGGDVVVFKHDPFEFNDSRLVATHLGADEAINVDPTIDPGADIPFALPGDEDWYRVEADATGTLDFQVFFRQIATVASGRPGLPGAGDLQLELFDSTGDLIAGFGLNDANDDERKRIPAVQGQVYYLRVFGASGLAINNYTMTILNEAAAVPFDIELDDDPADPTENGPAAGIPATLNSDTGRSRFDDITFDNTPTIFLRLDDGLFLHDLPGNPLDDTPPDEVIPIPFQTALLPGYRVAIFVEDPISGAEVFDGFATQVAEGIYTYTFGTGVLATLADGSHFISARVQMVDPANPTQTGFGARSQSLEIIVDTMPPPVFFGLPALANDGLDPSSDTGVVNDPLTFTDRVTSDRTPTFFGTAEADAFVRVFARDRNNALVLIAATTAEPTDGGDQFPDGRWVVTSNVDLNDPAFFNRDGLRTIEVQAVDVAGNVSANQILQIFIDTQGPQVTDVNITGIPTAVYNLFGLKPDNAAQGPTPLVHSLTISLRDLPPRVVPFLYKAIEESNAGTPGAIVLKGDNTGIIPIFAINVTNLPRVAGQPALATIELVFTLPGPDGVLNTFDDIGGPLPDDRYTLTVNDENVVDPAGNILDGESNAAEPNGAPTFPSGDGQPGGDFIARFTVDSRPEIGTYCCGSVYIDLNGNLVFDAVNKDDDQTNADKVFLFGASSDIVFAGDFTNGGPANGFDKLGAYGRFGGVFRFLLDINDDGVSDLNIVPTLQIDGRPIAGNFAPGHPGDEIGVFDGTTWYLDTNGNNNIDPGDTIFADGLSGFPISGDFDGNGQFDLGTYRPDLNMFFFHLNPLGAPNVITSLAFGFTGRSERPIAADMDQDGVTDIGLFVVERNGQIPSDAAEWYFLVSGFRPRIFGTVNTLDHPFDPTPFGTDLFAQFGNKLAAPVVGNFDPPSTGASVDVQVKPELSTNGALVVKGTLAADTITITPTADGRSVSVTISGLDLGSYPLDEINQIVIAAKAGDDTVIVDSSIAVNALIKGGRGNDVLYGGGGNNVIFGAGGNDELHGGVRRDVLIGAGGADQLFGGSDQDLLIGGRTTFGGNQAALNSVLAEWTSSRDLSTRIANLQATGSGASFAARLNGNWFLRGSGVGATVLDDGVRDLLDAAAGANWFFGRFNPVASPATDLLVGPLAADVRTEI